MTREEYLKKHGWKMKKCIKTGDFHEDFRRRNCKHCWGERNKQYRKTKVWKKHAKLNAEKLRGTASNWARSKVHMALTHKRIPYAKEFFCFDCGKRAAVYDHRNYFKPHDLEPVCWSCNSTRKHGANWNFKMTKEKQKEFYREGGYREDKQIRWKLVAFYQPRRPEVKARNKQRKLK